jgi:heptose I phosphotransferase
MAQMKIPTDKFVELSPGFFANTDFIDSLKANRLDNIDAVFAFDGGRDLAKANLAGFRSRCEFTLDESGVKYFLKRYDGVPLLSQLKNWFSHRNRAATAYFDIAPSKELAAAGVQTARVVAYGAVFEGLFEKRSFVITAEIANAESLEKKLPDFVSNPLSGADYRARREFIAKLADFARRFHNTGFRHRDFYLCHIFLASDEQFYLIDLQRAFQPMLLRWWYRVKDITQLYYSSPGQVFTRADRLRFYLRYRGKTKIALADRLFIRALKFKAWRMADHDIKNGRDVPFAM